MHSVRSFYKPPAARRLAVSARSQSSSTGLEIDRELKPGSFPYLGTPLRKTYIAIGVGKPWRSHSLDCDSGPENRAMVEHHRIFRNAELWSGRIASLPSRLQKTVS